MVTKIALQNVLIWRTAIDVRFLAGKVSLANGNGTQQPKFARGLHSTSFQSYLHYNKKCEQEPYLIFQVTV